MYTVFVSATFQKQFKALQNDLQRRIKSALKKLEENPFQPCPGADIIALTGTTPQKHRLRIGDYRIIYLIEGENVKVIEVFRRGRGYRK
ncbi:MAG: type II toxin-antitoxin system RelE/ParE family toxin [Candidatus Thermoplasmatota archaeon]|nr:type II toxin-antitoxin system RelE/ParE family toxin [Candidatus Thermoplasmatota archaeon]MCG2827529.1 type II toxin-antitoxin system RelE/ParE family toxin [Thermoplasmatales archaeon]